jgi:polyisoprenoid-binding protein YceI
MSDRKPIPKNQSEIVQDTINPYLNQGKPISQNVFTHRDNRALNTSRKQDNIKDISIGLEDIDYAVKYYFETSILPTVVQDGNVIPVPIMYGSPERWQSVQADGYYRDTNGKAVFPLIMYKRTNINKNRNLGNKIDGNLAALFQTFETRYNQKNQYDKFSILNNRIPSKQYYVSVVPDYVTITYECVILTNYVEQNNKIIESIEYAADSYWGDKNRYQFRTMIDSFATTNIINTGEDRIATTNVTLTVNGYLIPNTINQHLSDTNLHYSPSQVIFTLETTGSL